MDLVLFQSSSQMTACLFLTDEVNQLASPGECTAWKKARSSVREANKRPCYRKGNGEKQFGLNGMAAKTPCWSEG